MKGCYTVSRYKVPPITISIGTVDGSLNTSQYWTSMGGCIFFCNQATQLKRYPSGSQATNVIFDSSTPSGNGKYPLYMTANNQNSFNEPSRSTRMPRFLNGGQLDNYENMRDPRGNQF
jgi:hypothetical protein